jgi:hypothetical protein
MFLDCNSPVAVHNAAPALTLSNDHDLPLADCQCFSCTNFARIAAGAHWGSYHSCLVLLALSYKRICAPLLHTSALR